MLRSILFIVSLATPVHIDPHWLETVRHDLVVDLLVLA